MDRKIYAMPVPQKIPVYIGRYEGVAKAGTPTAAKPTKIPKQYVHEYQPGSSHTTTLM
jgi:hypothetical protein